VYEQPTNIIFYNLGASSLQVSLVPSCPLFCLFLSLPPPLPPPCLPPNVSPSCPDCLPSFVSPPSLLLFPPPSLLPPLPVSSSQVEMSSYVTGRGSNEKRFAHFTVRAKVGS
jgi:hypothetical protein